MSKLFIFFVVFAALTVFMIGKFCLFMGVSVYVCGGVGWGGGCGRGRRVIVLMMVVVVRELVVAVDGNVCHQYRNVRGFMHSKEKLQYCHLILLFLCFFLLSFCLFLSFFLSLRFMSFVLYFLTWLSVLMYLFILFMFESGFASLLNIPDEF